MSGWEELANAIIIQAIYDYRKALRNTNRAHYSKYHSIDDLERFFFGEWFALLSKCDPHYIVKEIRQEMHNENKTKNCK